MANYNYVYADSTTALPELLRDLLDADEVGSRAGRTREMTHVGITLRNPCDREVLVTDRKPSLVAQIAETMWVLAGRDDIGWLTNYLPRAADFSDDGKTWRAAYGRRIRAWEPEQNLGDHDSPPVDQLAYVIDTLKASPLSRQAVINLWDPVTDTKPSKDIPCNDWLSFSSRLGRLDLHVAVRSNDVIWGWSGINAFEWSTLQEVVASILGLEVGSLHFSTTSLHLYDLHWSKAESIVRSQGPALKFPKPSPRTFVRSLEELDNLVARWFQIEEAIREGGSFPQSVVDSFPDPLFRSWLRVLQWWWSKGDPRYLEPLKGTRLETATAYSVQPPRVKVGDAVKADQFIGRVNGDLRSNREPVAVSLKPVENSAFLRAAIDLHNEKHAAYGDSWKRRGEMLGIMANIARKVDRLGGAKTQDETSADTAMDLMIYLAKYRVWLDENDKNSRTPANSNNTFDANNWLRKIERRVMNDDGQPVSSRGAEEMYLTTAFDSLETMVTKNRHRAGLVEDMLSAAYALARRLWQAEKAVADEYRGADVD